MVDAVVALVCLHNIADIVDAEVADKFAVVVSTHEKQFVPV